MKRNFMALCLLLTIFLALTTNTLAASTINGQTGGSQITVSVNELTPGYYLCAVWNGDELLTLFDYIVGNDCKMETTVNIGTTINSNDNLQLGISGANTNSEPITLNVKVNSNSSDSDNHGNSANNSNYSNDSSDSGPAYKINLPVNLAGGRLSVQPAQTSVGSTVAITVAPDPGYTLNKISITDTNNKLLTISHIREQRYMFTMPASEVNVQATFQKQNEYTGTFYSLPFTDVKISDWYYKAVRYVFAEALMSGEGHSLFNPNGNLNRAMLVVILHRIEKEPQLYMPSGFTDITANQWYTNAVVWAKACGIVNGYEDNTFAPLQNITREETSVILYRYTQFKGYNLATKGSLDQFSDSNKISSWSVEAMQWAIAMNIINGNDNGTLAPTANITRAETATMIMRFLDI